MLEEADDDTRTATFRVYGPRSLTATLDAAAAFDGEVAACAGAGPARRLLAAAAARPARGSARFGSRAGRRRVKPAPFEYVAARSVEEALAALREDGARVLAGGQSLLPLLNARARARRRGSSTSTTPASA